MPYARAGRVGFHRLLATAVRGTALLSGCSIGALLVGLLTAPDLGAQDRPVPLEGLVVTATPTPRPAEAVSSSVTVLEGDALRAQGLTRVQDALEGVPGVSVVQGGSFGAVTSVFLRGAESDHVLVLVDGVQINQPGGAVDLAGLTLDNVERIEVVRGPASALYGSDAVAGVIQIVTRSGSPGGGLAGDLSVRSGTYGQRQWTVESSGGSQRTGFSMALTRRSGNGILPFNNAHDNTVFNGSFRFLPDERTWSKLTLRVGNRTYHFPTDGAGALVDRNQFTFGDETALGATLGREVADGVTVRALVGVTELNGGSDDESDGPADTLGYYAFSSLDHVRRASADVRATADLGGTALTLGGELERERQRSFTESGSQYGPSSDRSAFERRNAALYTHVSGGGGPLSYDVGGRLEDNQRFGTLATWQAGATLRLGGMGTRLRASTGTAIKEPTFYENYATGFAHGNPDLDPERSASWEVGVEQALAGGGVHVSATYFSQRLRDLIQYTFATASPEEPNFYNVAAADARGLELEGRARRGAVTGSLSWTWLHTRVRDAGFDQGPGANFVEGEPLIRRPEQTLSGQAAWAASGVRLSLGATWIGPRADRDFSTYPAAPVTLPGWVNVRGGADITLLQGGAGGASLALTVGAENLLGRAHQDVYGFAAPGRTVLVGLRAGFGGG